MLVGWRPLHAACLALCTLPALTFSSTWLRNLRTRPSCSIRRRPPPTRAWTPLLRALAEVTLSSSVPEPPVSLQAHVSNSNTGVLCTAAQHVQGAHAPTITGSTTETSAGIPAILQGRVTIGPAITQVQLSITPACWEVHGRALKPPEVNVPTNTTFLAADEMSMNPPQPGARFSNRLTLTLPASSTCVRSQR